MDASGVVLTFSVCLAAGVLAWGVAAGLIRTSNALGLLDRPGHRSSHVVVTPTGGGIGIVVAGTLAGVAAIATGDAQRAWTVLGLALLVAAFGLWDDLRPVPAAVRLAIQIVAVGGLLMAWSAASGVPLPLARELGDAASFALVLLAGVWWINLFNFMDGIDGLAGSQALFMLAAGALLASGGGIPADPAAIWMLCLASAAVGFLLHNWSPARIFMGDVGSTYLAYMIFALALWTVVDGRLTVAAWAVLGASFVSDATATLVVRLARGERPHEAHRSHAYQRLARRWGAHRGVVMLAMGVNVLWLAPLALACVAWPERAWAIALLAYAPVVAGVLWLGAGTPD